MCSHCETWVHTHKLALAQGWCRCNNHIAEDHQIFYPPGSEGIFPWGEDLDEEGGPGYPREEENSDPQGEEEEGGEPQGDTPEADVKATPTQRAGSVRPAGAAATAVAKSSHGPQRVALAARVSPPHASPQPVALRPRPPFGPPPPAVLLRPKAPQGLGKASGKQGPRQVSRPGQQGSPAPQAEVEQQAAQLARSLP